METKDIRERNIIAKARKSGRSSPNASQSSIKSKVDIMSYVK